MKRYGNLWKDISSKDNIRLAIYKTLKRKKINRAYIKLQNNIEKNVEDIHNKLGNETYKFGGLHSFILYEPKKRVIHCPPFYPDRIYHNCIINILQPIFYRNFTADTYSNIIGQGIHKLNKKLRKVLKENPEYYYVKLDIKKYFQSIDHDILKGKLRRLIKCTKTLKMLDAIIDSHSPGIPIGALPSQYFGNIMLSGLDHYIKEVLRIKYYYRYMDDLVLLVKNKEEAHKIVKSIIEKLKTIKLSPKNNIRIAPVSTGIDFVGYIFYPTHIRLRKRIKQNMIKKDRFLRNKKVNNEVYKKQMASYYGWCKYGNCRHLLKSVFKEKLNLFL